ncbi:MAG TPA: nucleotidyltransferase [Candidatus Nitrosotalea sp.]|nr:nucleotidyltransferase [Candidatus Nitrosotalea sp.]
MREAVEIANDIGNVVLIGAAAVMLHAKVGRSSEDLDFALTTELSHEALLDKGYIKFRDKRDTWQTPRYFKVDFFRKDVGEIPIRSILNMSTIIPVDSKNTLRVISLECLIVAKSRANRPTDREDLRLLAKKKFDDIDWDVIKSISKSAMEFEAMKRNMKFYHDT